MNASKQMRKYLIFSTGFLLLFSFIFIAFVYALNEAKLEHFDQIIIDQVLIFVNPIMTWMMHFFTMVSSTEAVLAILLISNIFMIFWKKRWEAIFLMIGTAGGALFNQILKGIFQRERPTLHRLIEIKGYSFPSGHSMVSVVFYGMICLFLCMFLKSKAIKVMIIILAACTVWMVGLSRVYLGVHYPSDVFAGFAAGAVWLVICLMGLKYVLQIRKS